MTTQELQQQFWTDINRIAAQQIKKYKLAHSREQLQLALPILRWLDFYLRYIPLKPRSVVFLSTFPSKLTFSQHLALNYLIESIHRGSDLNRFQSKGLIETNDISKRKAHLRTDLMLADWGIHHLHLTKEPIPKGKYFSQRSDWIVLCLVTDKEIGILDIKHHQDPNLFSDLGILEKMVDQWPSVMERHRLRGIKISRQADTLTSDEIKFARKSGCNTMYSIRGAVYMGAGMGVTSASTPTRVSLLANRIQDCIRLLADEILDENSWFSKKIAEYHQYQPQFTFRLHRGDLVLHEKIGNITFTISREYEPNNPLNYIHNILTPEWSNN